MNFREAVKQMIKNEHITQVELAEKMGFKTQAGVSSLLLKKGVSISTLLKVCEATEYEIVLRPKKGSNKAERTLIIDEIVSDEK